MLNVSTAQKQSLGAAAKQFGIAFFVIFGSQASGRIHPGSDLDIGYSPIGEDLSTKRRFELNQVLTKIFPGYEVDLVNVALVSPLMQHRAAFQGQLLAEYLPHSFTRFQMAAYINYIDTTYLRILRNRHLTNKYA